MTLALPRRFGDYLLLKALGQGGMGEVFLAKTAGLGGIERYCVVKTLRTTLSEQQVANNTRRFIDEARVVVRLSHRNIAGVLDVGAIGERLYIALEYVAGRDLIDILERAAERGRPGIPLALALYVTGELLEALDYAHRLVDPGTGAPLKLVHRDISPSNGMINFEGEVKLIDFGVAASTLKETNTHPNLVFGKLPYMSPEQASGRLVDDRSDQYSMGILMYEVLVGRRFFEGIEKAEKMQWIARGGYEPPRLSELDADVTAVIKRATSADPAERFESTGDMRDAVVRIEMERSLRAGAREMRAWMSSAFAADLEKLREEQSTFSRIALTDGAFERDESKLVRFASAGSDRLSQMTSTLLSEAVTVSDGVSTETHVAKPASKERAVVAPLAVQPPTIPVTRAPRWAAPVALALIATGAAAWFALQPAPVVPVVEPMNDAGPAKVVVIAKETPPVVVDAGTLPRPVKVDRKPKALPVVVDARPVAPPAPHVRTAAEDIAVVERCDLPKSGLKTVQAMMRSREGSLSSADNRAIAYWAKICSGEPVD